MLQHQVGRKTGVKGAAHLDHFAALEQEADALGDAVHREIAGHLEAAFDCLDACALERHVGILLYIEKIWPA